MNGTQYDRIGRTEAINHSVALMIVHITNEDDGDQLATNTKSGSFSFVVLVDLIMR